jgi:hypothetical protein
VGRVINPEEEERNTARLLRAMQVERDFALGQYEILSQKTSALEAVIRAELSRIEQLIISQDRAVTLLGQANQLAQDKFESNVAARFIAVNEFRSALEDLGKTMATRRELEAAAHLSSDRYETLNNTIGSLRSRLDSGEGRDHGEAAQKNEARQSVTLIQGFIATLLAIITLGLLAFTTYRAISPALPSRTSCPAGFTCTTINP